MRLGQARALGEPPRALEPDREVAVAEVEPHLARRARAARHHVERVAGEPPAALVDPVGEPERDEVRVGRDVRAVDLDVVARVGDHRRARRRRTSSMPRASFAPPVPPARTTTGPGSVGRPVMRMPACVLWRMLMRDHQRRQRLGDPRRARAGRRRSRAGRGSASISSATRALRGRGGRRTTSTSSSSAWLEVGERRGADGVQAR